MRPLKRPALFDDKDQPSDHAWYLACRGHVTKAGVRRALTLAWNAHGHLLAEPAEQFVAEFRRDFPARSWELYVLRYLVKAGASIGRAPRKGPDFMASLPGVGRFWIECVVPTHGTGPDAVRTRDPAERVGALGASEPVALRYTQVINDKLKKVNEYRAQGIVRSDEPVLIALNQGAIQLSDMHDKEVPLVVRVLFGIGETTAYVNPYTGKTRVAVPPMKSIEKKTGATVATTAFLDDSAAGIAGVLFARRSIFNLLPGHRRWLHLAHNHLALAPFPHGALPLRGEVWVSGQRLAHRGVLSRYGVLSRRGRGEFSEGQ